LLVALAKAQHTLRYRGSDGGIRELQMFLNAHGFLVSASGPGSLGRETNYFGASTKAALTRFQETYKDDILRPVGLNHGTGVLGPMTLRKIEKLLQR
jgi:peptidoglycan hydrolase-like protein with peptidoglycan-binding domain